MDRLTASAVQAWIDRPSPCAYRSRRMRDQTRKPDASVIIGLPVRQEPAAARARPPEHPPAAARLAAIRSRSSPGTVALVATTVSTGSIAVQSGTVSSGSAAAIFNLGEGRSRSALRVNAPMRQLLPPRIRRSAADRVFARHLGRRRVRPQAFRDDLLLHFDRPPPPPLATCGQLDPRASCTLYDLSYECLRFRSLATRAYPCPTSSTPSRCAAMCRLRIAYGGNSANAFYQTV